MTIRIFLVSSLAFYLDKSFLYFSYFWIRYVLSHLAASLHRLSFLLLNILLTTSIFFLNFHLDKCKKSLCKYHQILTAFFSVSLLNKNTLNAFHIPLKVSFCSTKIMKSLKSCQMAFFFVLLFPSLTNALSRLSLPFFLFRPIFITILF